MCRSLWNGNNKRLFQQLGKQLFPMEILNSSVSNGAILTAVPLSIRIEIPSGPLALEASSDCISIVLYNLLFSTVVIKRASHCVIPTEVHTADQYHSSRVGESDAGSALPTNHLVHYKKAFVILTIAFATRIARNSPLWQPAMATQHTWSTRTSEVATRAGKFA